MKIHLLAAAALLSVAAPSAAVTTFTFSQVSPVGVNAAGISATAGGRILRVSGNRYTVAPTALTNISQFTGTASVRRTGNLATGGVGVNSEDNIAGSPAGTGGNDPAQVDTDGATNEILRLELVESNIGSFRINSVTLSAVDPDDTFRIYRLGAGGALNVIAFGGDIAGTGANAFTGGTATYLSGTGNNQQWRITFQPFSAPSDVFYLTSRKDTADGYRLTTVVGSAVPEPATWAMLVAGFGMVGVGARRRKRAIAA